MSAALTLHATTVAFEGRAILIKGASGSGKSALGLELLSIGARLVADDQTVVTAEGPDLIASCPPPLRGLIEARGLGLLRAPHDPQARVALVVDLDQTEEARLPPERSITIMGQPLSLVLGVRAAHFHVALRHYVLYGRQA
ncbi:MAG: serine kinase [Cypionkella sp.]|nr:serine kinase [Cypionkella sp.]